MHFPYSPTNFEAIIGAPTGRNPRGYVRGDNVSAVVYATLNQQIHELALTDGGWVHNSLSAYGGQGGTEPMGYRRSDNMSSVVYRGIDGHIHELALVGEEAFPWRDFDLTAHSGAPVGGSHPMGYVRHDNVSSVVYTGTDGHIHELALNANDGGGWRDFDLTKESGAIVGGSTPMGYVRHDSVSSVVYTGTDGHIHELALNANDGGGWRDFDLTKESGAIVGGSTPMGYVRHDNVSVVDYTGADGHIHELALNMNDGGAWRDFDLTMISGAPAGGLGPIGCNKQNGSSSVIYSSPSHEIHELLYNKFIAWGYTNLSKEFELQGNFHGSTPMGYVRSDGRYAIVFEQAARIHEFLLVKPQ